MLCINALMMLNLIANRSRYNHATSNVMASIWDRKYCYKNIYRDKLRLVVDAIMSEILPTRSNVRYKVLLIDVRNRLNV